MYVSSVDIEAENIDNCWFMALANLMKTFLPITKENYQLISAITNFCCIFKYRFKDSRVFLAKM